MTTRDASLTESAWHANRRQVRRWQLDQWLSQRQQLERAEAGLVHDRAWRDEKSAYNERLRTALEQRRRDDGTSSEEVPAVDVAVAAEEAGAAEVAAAVEVAAAAEVAAAVESALATAASPTAEVSPETTEPTAVANAKRRRPTPVDAERRRFDYRPASPSLPPRVSIITPFFNPGEHFRATAESVLGQSLPAWEWVVVDDASTDLASVEILAEIAAREPRLRVIRRTANGGPGAARNDAFAAARAPFLLQLDADDMLEATAAEKWLWHLETHPEVGFVNGHTVCHGAIEGIWQRGFAEGAGFLERNFVGGRGMLRRAVVDAAGGYDPTLPLALEDWEFWLRCAEAGHWGRTLDEALDWQHRRGSDAEQWADWDGGEREQAARRRVRALHPGLTAERFPALPPRWPQPFEAVTLELPFANPLAKAKPRLLLVVAWADVGGTDRFNLDLLDQLAERGWETTVVTTLPSPDRWREEYLRRTPDLFLMHRFLRAADHPRFLRYLVESRQPDVVVVSHSELGYQLLPALRAWHPAAVYVDYLHIVEPDWKSGGYPRQSILAQPQLDRTLASSRQVADWLVARGAARDRLGVVYTGIDAERFRPHAEARQRLRGELGIAAATPVVLFAGRLCAQKQPLVAVRVFAELVARGSEFVALVVGDGEEREAVELEVARYGVGDRVRLLGSRDSAQIAELMAASDLFFLPSEREGISLALFEAMASGLAIVATDVGGQRELLVEGCGVLVPAGESATHVALYADQLAALLADTERRDALGRAARERVGEQFQLSRMGDEMVRELELARRSVAAPSRRAAVERGVAESWAQQVVEFQRLTALCDQLWSELYSGAAGARSRGAGPAASRLWRTLHAIGVRVERFHAWGTRLASRLRPWPSRGAARRGR